MAHSRRKFLKHSGILAAGGLLLADTADGIAARVAEDFAASDFTDRYAKLFGDQAVVDSESIELILPEIAEDGAVVPVTIRSELDGIDRLYLLADKNPTPLVAELELAPVVAVYLTARIKLAESCRVTLIARRDGGLLRCSRWVNVMRGGCGSG
ncbi:thiosulfate oxidation carrier protein SoxY [Methylomonas sp. EFPC3]|uniref:thiosulfate oxidation carrier protein SoxY n=1 Tax=Methylomonas sp. EFPC3 TaxID=3021710 RepID=UPI002415D6B2|nr:thiosulfate oxidation carrier protein SoxY [Methylomonas sp. EFPC3]WFP51019.1 thiosulfate oxidation carrier protein SoxY [Methylomonas sp. EFPC3]